MFSRLFGKKKKEEKATPLPDGTLDRDILVTFILIIDYFFENGLDMRVWSIQHVTAWLEKNELKEYSDAFVKNAISGSELADLTEKDLETLGVKKLGSRKKLIKLIQDMTALKRENSMDVQEGLYHTSSSMLTKFVLLHCL